jgi:hypothetical protein
MNSINWGQLNPGVTKNLSIWVRNEGTAAIMISKSLSNVSPSTISNYLTLNWNYNSQTLSPSAVLEVTLSLTVAANTPAASFGFDTTITAMGN